MPSTFICDCGIAISAWVRNTDINPWFFNKIAILSLVGNVPWPRWSHSRSVERTLKTLDLSEVPHNIGVEGSLYRRASHGATTALHAMSNCPGKPLRFSKIHYLIIFLENFRCITYDEIMRPLGKPLRDWGRILWAESSTLF